jgi:hypothetical protein
LEERTKAASRQFAFEWSELEWDHEDYWKDLQKVFARELEVTRKEKRLAKKEMHLDQREEVITELQTKLNTYNKMLEEQRDQQAMTVEDLRKVQQGLDDRASSLALAEENLKEKNASLDKRAADLAWREKDPAFREEMLERRDKLLANYELKAEEKEQTLGEWVCQFEAAQVAQAAQAAQVAPGSKAVEVMRKTLEDLRAEHRTGVQYIAAWAGEASSTLMPLGVSPIPVFEQSASISDALPVLDSAVDRLRCLDQILGARLEAEGSRLCQSVLEYVLTCFRSHDPAISLAPVIAGPVADTEVAAREGIQDAVDAVAERFQRDPADDE